MLKVKPVTRGSCQRMSFGKIDEVMDMPNLIEVQKASYNGRYYGLYRELGAQLH